jgi:hypothetical protein
MVTANVSGGGNNNDNSGRANRLDGTPFDPNIAECPNPNNCTVPIAPATDWITPQDDTPIVPDVTECPNPNNCTVPYDAETH